MYQCKFCYKQYKQKRSQLKHQKECKIMQGALITPKQPPKTVENNNNILLTSINHLLKKHMDRIDKRIDEKIGKIETPKQIINNNNIINNVTITQKLPKCIFSELVNRMGQQKAVNMINLYSAKNEPLKIYKELYPSKILEDNPVIFENNSFKFLAEDGEIVYDQAIIQQIADNVQAAMLYASSHLIDESLKLNSTKRLFELYDIGSVQRNVRKIKFIKQQIQNYIISELSAK